MAVNGPQIDRTARPAAREEDVEPRRASEQPGADVGDHSMSRPAASRLSTGR